MITIPDEVDATELYGMVVKSHVRLINQYWNDIINKTVKLTKQDENKATYWPQRRPEDGLIKMNMTIDEASRLVRAVTHPYPGAFLIDKERRIRIWKATFSKYGGSYRLSDGYMTPIDFEIEALNE